MQSGETYRQGHPDNKHPRPLDSGSPFTPEEALNPTGYPVQDKSAPVELIGEEEGEKQAPG
jgi:hypothetical protein